MRGRGLLVCGTASNVGKTTVVAGLCRLLARNGVNVAPFKAQNMSLNSGVTAEGHEIARAQILQAEAAGVDPHVHMNPVLIKPTGDMRSQLIVLGRPVGEIGATDYTASGRRRLLDTVVSAYDSLLEHHDVVIAEGAGSPAEFNLRDGDIANFGLAAATDLPVVLVGDIDRGGVFASFLGTLACVSPRDRSHVRGFIINKFRGDPTVLAPGIDELERRTSKPVLGVLPYDPVLRLDAEDSLATTWAPEPTAPLGPDLIRIAVVRLPRASNLTDIEPLAVEPGVVITYASVPQQLADADLVVIPGTRTTVEDLEWLRATGLADAISDRARLDRPTLGICGGYQMLGRTIDDSVESGRGTVEGLGLLPAVTTFHREKTVARTSARLADGSFVEGYEIHHGRVGRDGGAALLGDEGCRVGNVHGTTWHGLFDNDRFRQRYLADVAAATGRRFVPSTVDWAGSRNKQLDRVADLLQRHLDLAALGTAVCGIHLP